MPGMLRRQGCERQQRLLHSERACWACHSNVIEAGKRPRTHQRAQPCLLPLHSMQRMVCDARRPSREIRRGHLV